MAVSWWGSTLNGYAGGNQGCTVGSRVDYPRPDAEHVAQGGPRGDDRRLGVVWESKQVKWRLKMAEFKFIAMKNIDASNIVVVMYEGRQEAGTIVLTPEGWVDFKEQILRTKVRTEG